MNRRRKRPLSCCPHRTWGDGRRNGTHDPDCVVGRLIAASGTDAVTVDRRSSCPHAAIVPINANWGRCVACGDSTFPLSSAAAGIPDLTPEDLDRAEWHRVWFGGDE